MVGAIGYAAKLLGNWADGGDYSVYNIMTGGAPEFTLLSNVALLSYGVALLCLDIMVCLITYTAAQLTIDPETRSCMGCIFTGASLLAVVDILGTLALCLWQYSAVS